jgi:hypothetical protein
MPFGLTNAPATFQRLMESCMGDLYLTYCLLYLDDIVIYSSMYEEHLVRLEAVFRRLSEAGLKLKASKCKFFQHSIKYLGHVVSAEGISADPDKIAAVRNYPVPTNVKEVQSFLGFVGFYRRFVKGFSTIARPLHELTQGTGCTGSKKSRKRRPKVPFLWGPNHQKAFEELIHRLITAPVLAYADYTKPFILHTDASMSGLGAILYQEQEGKERVIAYASRGLKPAERNYPVHKWEFLALKWAVTEKFHDYLCGNHFTARTDNNPLTYVLSTAKLDATGHRWVAQLANYNFNIVYRSGKSNIDADVLSRICWPEVVTRRIGAKSVTAILNKPEDVGLVETMSCSQMVVPDLENIDLKPIENWATKQKQDPLLEQVILALEESAVKLPPSGRTNVDKPKSKAPDLEGPMGRSLQREWSNLCLRGGVLYRKRGIGQDLQYQMVLPEKYRTQALSGCHDDMGHLGRDRTLDVVRQRFFWPGMAQSVAYYVSACDRCIRRKTLPNQRALMVSIQSTQPMQMVCIDFLSLEESKGGYSNVLVVTDNFTRYAQAYPTKNQTAKTTAKVLYKNLFHHYGFPAKIHSDQGQNFLSELVHELYSLSGIQQSRTTPYHPMANGQCERFNRTLLNILGTLDLDQKKDWKSYIGPLVHRLEYAYGIIHLRVTGAEEEI